MTVEQFEKVFQKKTMDPNSVKLRKDCSEFLSRCETIYADMKPSNKERYRKLVYGKEDENEGSKDSLLLKDISLIYLESKQRDKLKTKSMYQTAFNSFVE